jgi:pyruvate dehydrogenase E1 component beta subunit/2-oxoisovalerate dehydrogenase E1 component beta subunit
MSVTYIDAIHQAMAELLAEDEKVFLYGEDIAGKFGGAFKATKGLAEQFPGRVLNAPIAEDAIMGLAIGAALSGMKPIVEMQFADFGTLAQNQLGNNAAAHYYRTGIPVNVTLRMPCGGTPGGGPYHSQSVEALFAHYPGVHVLCPATVADAYYMLKQAVQIPDPVVFMEHKFLYRWLKADTWVDANPLPIGRARIARPGRHATVVAFSAMVPEALKAADELAANSGYSLEVVDLRSVKPLDTDTILGTQLGRLPHAFLAEHLEGNFAAEALLSAGSGLTSAELRDLARIIRSDASAYRRLRRTLDDAVDQALLRVRASYRDAVPAYDPTDDRTKLLLPLCLVEDAHVDCALVLDLQPSGAYRAASVLALPRAYACARVISREQPGWLAADKVLG